MVICISSPWKLILMINPEDLTYKWKNNNYNIFQKYLPSLHIISLDVYSKVKNIFGSCSPSAHGFANILVIYVFLIMSEIENFPSVTLLSLVPVFHIFPVDQLIYKKFPTSPNKWIFRCIKVYGINFPDNVRHGRYTKHV